MAQLEEIVKSVDEDVYRKCMYVLQEIERTLLAAQKLKQGDLKGLGLLMFETHAGLSGLYPVSCRELDFLVDSVKNLDNVLGARMMGGGFGGCTINLVKGSMAAGFLKKLKIIYQRKFSISLDTHLVEIGNGSTVPS